MPRRRPLALRARRLSPGLLAAHRRCPCPSRRRPPPCPCLRPYPYPYPCPFLSRRPCGYQRSAVVMAARSRRIFLVFSGWPHTFGTVRTTRPASAGGLGVAEPAVNIISDTDKNSRNITEAAASSRCAVPRWPGVRDPPFVPASLHRRRCRCARRTHLACAALERRAGPSKRARDRARRAVPDGQYTPVAGTQMWLCTRVLASCYIMSIQA